MAEKRIEIQMAVVGAAEAAAGVGKSTEAVKELSAATEKSAEATAAAATEARQEMQINIERAKTLQVIAEQASSVGYAMKDMADQIRRDAPEVAANLDMAADGAAALGSAATMAAQGFTVGGPFGAAVGAVVGTLAPSLKSAFDDMKESMLGAAASQNTLTENTRKLAEMQARSGEFPLARQLAEDFDLAKVKADGLLATMQQMKEVTAAEKSANVAERDAADDEAIRKGANPLDVKRKRAQDDAAEARAEIEAERRDAETIRAARYEQSQKAFAAWKSAERAQGEGGEDAVRLGSDYQQADSQYKEALRLQASAEATAPARIRQVDAREQIRLGRLTDEETAAKKAADDKKRREDQAAESRAKAEAEREAKAAIIEADDARLDQAEGRLDSTAIGSAGKFGAAGSRLPNTRLGKDLMDIDRSLSNGADAKEIQKIQQQFQAATKGLGGATLEALRKMLAEMDKQAKDIKVLEGQIKNSRRGI